MDSLAPDTKAWLIERLAVTGNDSVELTSRLTPAIIRDLKSYQWRHKSPEDYVSTVFYRGTDRADYKHYSPPHVFGVTYDPTMARNFGDSVYMFHDIETEDILIDTTLFSEGEILRLGGFPEEQEVILLPRSSGSYKVTLVG